MINMNLFLIVFNFILLFMPREQVLNSITKDLIDLFTAKEDPDNKWDAILLTSEKKRMGNTLFIELISTKDISRYLGRDILSEDNHFVEYGGRKIFTLGRDSFWWIGNNGGSDLYGLPYELISWRITRHQDNTLNTFLTTKRYDVEKDDISDIESLFSRYNLLKDDKMWATEYGYVFENLIWDVDPPIFVDKSLVYSYLTSAFLSIPEDVLRGIRVYARVVLNPDGTLNYKGVEMVGGKIDRKYKAKIKKIVKRMCNKYKMTTAVYKGTPIYFRDRICVFPVDMDEL